MVLLKARDGFYCASAQTKNTGGAADLTAWDNAQVALIVAELNAIDWFKTASIVHTKPRTVNIMPMPATHIPKRVTVGVMNGNLVTTHWLQTGIFTYFVMGACTTTEATPNIHAITKQTGEAPIFLAFHYEKEGTTDNRRKDLLGFAGGSLDITCSEADPIALQVFTSRFAYSGAGGNLAEPTAFVQATHAPYNWYNYRSASGASAFLYNAGALNVQIVGLAMHIGWSDNKMGTFDAAGYPTDGLCTPPFDASITLTVDFTDAAGTAIDTISDLAHDAYAGDLDVIVDFYESATRYLKYTWDDMFIDPESYEELFKDEGDWYDGATFTLKFRNETSSLVVEEKNALNNDYYENPV